MRRPAGQEPVRATAEETAVAEDATETAVQRVVGRGRGCGQRTGDRRLGWTVRSSAGEGTVIARDVGSCTFYRQLNYSIRCPDNFRAFV